MTNHQITQKLSSAPIRAFTGVHRFLSNFYLTPVYTDGFNYPSSEHAFQAAKTVDLKEKQRIAELPDAREAKRLGKQVALRPDWDRIKDEMMWQVLVAKYSGFDMHTLLSETASRELQDGNIYHETYWGVCLCGTHENTGLNRLGKQLMLLRTEFRAGGSGLYAARPWLGKVWT